MSLSVCLNITSNDFICTINNVVVFCQPPPTSSLTTLSLTFLSLSSLSVSVFLLGHVGVYYRVSCSVFMKLTIYCSAIWYGGCSGWGGGGVGGVKLTLELLKG